MLQQVSTAVNAGNNDIASDLSDADRDKVLPASRTASPRLQHIQLEPAGTVTLSVLYCMPFLLQPVMLSTLLSWSAGGGEDGWVLGLRHARPHSGALPALLLKS